MPLGSLITPAGDQGPPGVQGVAGPNAVSTQVGNRAQLGSDSKIYVPPYPFADASQGGLLRQLTGRTTDFVDGSNTCQDVATAIKPVIWYVRNRTFNAIGNPNFEVDQRNAGNQSSNMTGPLFLQDRWKWGQTSPVTGRCAAQQVPVIPGSTGLVVPGGTQLITSNCLAVTLLTGQATLGASDAVWVYQQIEGSRFREMAGDGHSLNLLVNCTTPLKFSVFIRDASNAHSLVIQCQVVTANTWTLIPLPNLAAWPSAGTFYTSPGVFAYTIGICLAAGTSFTATNAGIWQTGNFLGSQGQDNFLDMAFNSVFKVAFMQHEPGLYCSYLMDSDFETNLVACQRYYQQSCPYGALPTETNQLNGAWQAITFAGDQPFGQISFKRAMATSPTVLGYSPVTGVVNKLRDISGGIDRNITGPVNVGDGGFSGFTTVSTPSTQWEWNAHWTADTNL